ncbi:hypothetical protein BBO99_00005365 [Phytophthora kernoviae]|uniref:Wilms tumor protein homolog n=2 Tax=Phytophthora kernoviae TaxID=325452 RepID=A0A3R7GYM6_9STRA|nr:hypothetical protein G195_010004 [Phytophthora kernoviae 00238/432]KAG2524045.1 hypothetical protein JM16_005122 [Phytophthora kernoviae]KAG2525931.1 hypothetical protein JM18_004617 [Phytophthora kernoviae]RLN37217.1 hypothetical protein BBI17_005309 [Phytophthora kernoviae]RLN79297.1 hypothetical protein BBO99_00005365 [Phytophthora kernoviae]
MMHPPSSPSPVHNPLKTNQQSPSTPQSKERPFLCEEPGCGRRFNRKFTLSEHMKTHTGEKPYVCPLAECSRRFSTSGNLARHKRLHASLKPFECDINGCKRSFPSQEKLDHHIKIHMGRRTHMCRMPGCTKTFSTAGNLTRHIKNRHPELAQNTFSSYQYTHMTPVHHRPATPSDMSSPHLTGSNGVMLKLESVSPVFSPDSVEMAFHDELSTFQATYESTQFEPSRPQGTDHCQGMGDATVTDISRCSMSVLDEVIEFELAKNV